MSRNIAFVPIRKGSTSIRDKNIKPLHGRPLVYWTLKALDDSKLIDEVVVAHDSEKYARIVEDMRLSKVRTYFRKPENADDAASTESVMLEFIESEKAGLERDETFILAQATSPLTEALHVTEALELYDTGKGDSVISCARQKRFLWNEDGSPKNYDPYRRPRRQEFDGELVENGALYVSSVGRIVESRNRISGKILVYEMPEYTLLEIDEPEDWLYAEQLMKKYKLSSSVWGDKVELFLTDVDGVLTDAGMYYGEDGNELKKFNTRDGKGIALLRDAGIQVGFVTSESTHIVEKRAAKLSVDYCRQGVQNKLGIVRQICSEKGIPLSRVAYIGDDVNDLELLQSVGCAACPSDAHEAIRSLPHVKILSSRGGEGAVREFAELVLEAVRKE